ncbi:MAG: DUF3551 domain-containing protein [Bradyrhizobium sp.]|nr:DUF3551 domain-containing protein [Bradyrhizobium sp.]MBI5260662.1 DUF3551 domain-containing protein [Bradyrhizobium sp.]
MHLLYPIILAFGLMAAPVHAQTYDPSYPVCLQVWILSGSYIECRYTTMAQCRASASGRSAMCQENPYWTRPQGYGRPRPQRVY